MADKSSEQRAASSDSGPISGLAGKFLNEAFQRYPSQYFAVLPYNLNWMLDDRQAVRDILTGNPIVVADIGARGGHMGELEGLRKFIAYYGFDADKAECARLNAAPPADFTEYRIFPHYIGADMGPVEFHIYRQPGESSRLRPSEDYQRRFAPGFGIDRTITVDGARLDDLLDAPGLRFPDVLKLDTQGTELDILKASPKSLARALLVEVEVEFIEMYAGQPLFHDVARFMHEQGFELLYLNRVFQNRYRYAGEARGQHTFADALFGRRDDRIQDRSLPDLARYALLLINYGHVDIACDIWLANPVLRERFPSLESFFSPRREEKERTALMAADKTLCAQLHRRRTNQIPFDSDRSWPFR